MTINLTYAAYDRMLKELIDRRSRFEEERLAFIPEGIEEVCDDCGGDTSKCGQGCPVWNARALMPTVSPLYAVCDQIKELHPSSRPWTSKATASTNDGGAEHER